MKQNSFVIKGDICYSPDRNTLLTFENSWLVCKDGLSAGVFRELPEEFGSLKVYDYTGMLVMPGLSDLHLHAPQFPFRGLGMDEELLDWLNRYAFPEEGKYSDLDYAGKAYAEFSEAMRIGATTRACIFGTVHVPATELLMELMEKTGLISFVGKVNMDRNCPNYIVEDTEKSASDTQEWLNFCEERGFERTKPILTPRFVPACTDELMRRLGEMRGKGGVPVQSHLSENPAEVEFVGRLSPEAEFYGDAYDRFGMFGNGSPTVMAHCVYSGEDEMERMKKNGVFIAHCPQSNANIASGVAPIRRYLDGGLNCGLGTDLAGGASDSIFRAMTDAIQMSKIRWRLLDSSLKPLSFEEAFWLGTKGGGSFFGSVGSFEEGYELDAVAIKDEPGHCRSFTLRERLEKLAYLFTGHEVVHKFVSGEELF